MNDIKVSVIIPVYNTEEYLEECIDSVINQTLEEIEIICINDGSTDNSLEILNASAEKDRRIKVLSHENKGLGATRNVGIDLAKGEFIYFLDSDDFIDPNTLEETYSLAKEKDLDCVIFQGLTYDDENKRFYEERYYTMDHLISDTVFNYKDIQDIIFSLSVNVGHKLFKREFLLRTNARFPNNLIFEDNPFHFKVMLNAERLFFIKKRYFKRRRRANSITSSKNKKYFDIIPITDEVFSVFKEFDLIENFEKELYAYKINSIFIWFEMIEQEYKREFYKKIKDHFESIEDKECLNIKNKTFDNIKKSNTLEEFYLLMETDKLNEELKNKNSKINEYEENNKKFAKEAKTHTKEIKKLKKEAKTHTKEIKKLKKEAKTHTKEIKKLKKEVKKLEKINNSLLNSNSWKLTSYFRKIGRILRKL